MLGITSLPVINSSFKSKIGKKQNLSKPQQSVVDTKTETKPKKKMSNTTKILIGTGIAIPLLVIGGFLINKKIQKKRLERIVDEIAREIKDTIE